MDNKSFIEREVNDFRQFLKEILPDYNTISVDELSTMLLAYDAIIRANFILWLMRTKDAVKTQIAK